MNSKRILIWTTGIDDVIAGRGLVGGLTVQLMLWAKVFHENNWDVYSFTIHRNKHKSFLMGTKYLYYRRVKILNILFENFFTVIYLLKVKPTVIITRGASRKLLALSLASKLFRFKLIHMLASDSDVQNGQELIQRPWDKKLYRLGFIRCSYIVVQNHLQKTLVDKQNPKAKTLLIPNVWPQSNEYKIKEDLIIWVANFRELKRPMLFLELAKRLPQQQFIMVGDGLDKLLYNSCEQVAKIIPNLVFKGAQSLEETNLLFSKCKLFICTSEIEGFPNTFLQAWCNAVPIISSFDPSDIIKKENLGLIFSTVDEAIEAIHFLNNRDEYEMVKNNIINYFYKSHNSQKQYNKLVAFFNIC
ncbi:glycosyltransferase family 4 protein [Pontibacter pamirensis]|uniref:glycosyltransferase family 4 protein n=1 Tax=Pontibacter pamirensis TaxID=2562824 RepID=UPI00138950A7|nr:glycosyltransferase family 4 protein [Pontibacter pamirensis]